MWGQERNWATSPIAICQKLQGMLTSSVSALPERPTCMSPMVKTKGPIVPALR